MSMRKHSTLFVTAALLFGALALTGCDEGEQGRILRYEKGVYLGKPDSGLTEQQVDELRQRARMQQGG